MKILVIYASVDGQAAKIARRVAQVVARGGHEVTTLAAADRSVGAAITACDAVVVGGSIRYERYSRALEAVVRKNRSALDARPNAFFSVCMSAGGPGARPVTAWGYVERFVASTGWRPNRLASFAGALLYTRYNPFIRFVMSMISRSVGGETDTSRDHEYTDWAVVDRFASEFELPLRSRQAA